MRPATAAETRRPLGRSAVAAIIVATIVVVVALGAVAAIFLRPPFTMPRECDSEGPRLGVAMETFLRDKSGEVKYGPASVTICDSVPGVVVSMRRQTGPVDLSVLFAALTTAGCVRSEYEFDPNLRSCPLESGKQFLVEVGRSDGRSGSPKPGETFTIFGSADLG